MANIMPEPSRVTGRTGRSKRERSRVTEESNAAGSAGCSGVNRLKAKLIGLSSAERGATRLRTHRIAHRTPAGQ